MISVNCIIIDLVNALLPMRHQAITWINAHLLSIGPEGIGIADSLVQPRWQVFIWANADLFSIGPLGTNFGEIQKMQ